LFLGYLLGVPFFWITAQAWPAWLVGVGLLVGLFYLFDRYNFLQAPTEVRERETAHETFGILGAKNFLPLALILVAVIVLPAGFREAAIAAAAIYSYRTTAKPVHEANHFSFGPIKEVAWLFAGIFATMVPAIDYLQGHAAEMGIRHPMNFYWMSGSLSAVLDNAPTYVTFLAAAFGLHGMAMREPGAMTHFLAQHGSFAVAVSLGSVMFGAVTYIGNGPNLMVKGIADHARVHTPGFFTYILKYSLPLLVPVLAVVGWLFVHPG
jgi:Na+/H+ antiporter NhaD/arsenite permease-like protein